VVEKNDGREALEYFPSDQFHLVLTDNRMPRMSGVELLRRIRQLPGGENVDMVVYSAYGDMQNTIEAIRAGAYDYLLKPLNINELVDMLKRVELHQRTKNSDLSLQHHSDYDQHPVTSATDIQAAEEQHRDICGMIVYSESMKAAVRLAEQLHQDRCIPVLIQGETGTGKELIARLIHHGRGGEDKRPFVAINCATIPETTFESELFGYEAGSFSGGLPRGKKGKMDIAEGGTLFLDEIGEMPVNMQVKLLRVLQEKEFFRVGGLKPVKTDVRIICATNQDLEARINEGNFRKDLFYRLNVGNIYMPPLRQRKEDIIPLAHRFLLEFAEAKGKNIRAISRDAVSVLLSYDWPGNVRELRNVMEWMVFIGSDSTIHAQELRLMLSRSKSKDVAPQEANQNRYVLPEGNLSFKLSRQMILDALKRNHGNKTETAKYLGISRSSLYYRLKNM
jgi:DNA-binding NtrC family response regulator